MKHQKTFSGIEMTNSVDEAAELIEFFHYIIDVLMEKLSFLSRRTPKY